MIDRQPHKNDALQNDINVVWSKLVSDLYNPDNKQFTCPIGLLHPMKSLNEYARCYWELNEIIIYKDAIISPDYTMILKHECMHSLIYQLGLNPYDDSSDFIEYCREFGIITNDQIR